MTDNEIAMRINVLDPPAGVTMRVQKGRDELLGPTIRTSDMLSFDFPIRVDMSSGTPNFLGKFAQGPKNSRFIYVNSGTYAGQEDTCWSRRAKISLMSIAAEQILTILALPGAIFEIGFQGTGRDGGPVCGSIRSLGDGWKIIKE